ncbi:MAG: corrinoid protein [Anaerolineae bacterium]|nr:corrinoid protein [Anaerolineae bacterium]MDW8100695.1 corrinoid protein [Anaerolineae bacterium]
MFDLTPLMEAVINGNAPKARELTSQALEAGVSPGVILQEGLIPGMAEVGRRFECREFYVPELLIAARAMHAALDILRPLLSASNEVKPLGKVIIGTVRGDLHDIGKNLVKMMLEGSGFEVKDLGIDVSPEKFVNAVKEEGCDIVAMSALLTTTMPNMKATIEALTEAGLREKVKIMIGGAPITQEYADQIGADGYGEDANQAVRVAKRLLGISLN